jgi:hypothetical protein
MVEMRHSIDTKKTVESNEKARKDTRKGEWRIVFYKCEELCGDTFFLQIFIFFRDFFYHFFGRSRS